LCDTVRFQCYKGTGASLFSRCTLMCEVYVCNKDATARVAEDATGASAEWQKLYHLRKIGVVGGVGGVGVFWSG
jgi:hypothetical protein